jgi:hypothetical protein
MIRRWDLQIIQTLPEPNPLTHHATFEHVLRHTDEDAVGPTVLYLYPVWMVLFTVDLQYVPTYRFKIDSLRKCLFVFSSMSGYLHYGQAQTWLYASTFATLGLVYLTNNLFVT